MWSVEALPKRSVNYLVSSLGLLLSTLLDMLWFLLLGRFCCIKILTSLVPLLLWRSVFTDFILFFLLFSVLISCFLPPLQGIVFIKLLPCFRLLRALFASQSGVTESSDGWKYFIIALGWLMLQATLEKKNLACLDLYQYYCVDLSVRNENAVRVLSSQKQM